MKLTGRLLLLTSLLLSPSLAQAQDAPTADVKDAETYAEQAYEAYAAKDYAEAVSLYQKANKAAPSPDIVYNIAKIYDTKLKDRELAMTFYRRYLSDPGADPDRMKEVTERLAELKEADAIATSPPPPTSGDPAPAPAPAPGAAPAAPSDGGGWSGAQIAGLVMTITGVVGAGVGAGFGVAAMSKADRANELCEGDACSSQEGVDATDSAKTFATVSTLGIGIGAAVAVSGVLLMVLAPNDDGADQTGFVVVPLWGPEQGGLGIQGRF